MTCIMLVRSLFSNGRWCADLQSSWRLSAKTFARALSVARSPSLVEEGARRLRPKVRDSGAKRLFSLGEPSCADRQRREDHGTKNRNRAVCHPALKVWKRQESPLSLRAQAKQSPRRLVIYDHDESRGKPDIAAAVRSQSGGPLPRPEYQTAVIVTIRAVVSTSQYTW